MTATAPAPVKTAHDYSGLIEMLETALEDARAELRGGRPSASARLMLEARVSHLRMGIQNAREAEKVTEKAVQFGSHVAENTFRIAPRLDDFSISTARQFSAHRYVATDPLEIAWLRRLVREGQMQEVPMGSCYLVPVMDRRTGVIGEGEWVDAKVYEKLTRTGRG